MAPFWFFNLGAGHMSMFTLRKFIKYILAEEGNGLLSSTLAWRTLRTESLAATVHGAKELITREQLTPSYLWSHFCIYIIL